MGREVEIRRPANRADETDGPGAKKDASWPRAFLATFARLSLGRKPVHVVALRS